MPLGQVHTARQMSPDRCDKIRQKDIAPGVVFNYCIKGTKAEVESVHFDANQFTPDEARAWLKKHDFKTDQFIPASGKKTETKAAEPDLGILARADAEIRASATGFCEIEAQAAGESLSRVNMLAYTGVPMKLDGFHYPVVVDLETLKVPRQKVPILRSHDAERVAGHSDKIEVTSQRLRASGLLSGPARNIEDVQSTARHGFPWQVSIGAQTTKRPEYVPPGESVKVNGRNWDGPILVARDALLRELSLLPMGADANTDAGFSAEALRDIRGFSEDQPRDDQGRFADGGGGGSHNVKLPKDPKRLTVDQAKAALEQMGYKVEGRSFDMNSKTAFTHVTKPDGSKAKLSADQVKQIVYAGVRGECDIDLLAVATTRLDILAGLEDIKGG